jgi:hypothetical protein
VAQAEHEADAGGGEQQRSHGQIPINGQ